MGEVQRAFRGLPALLVVHDLGNVLVDHADFQVLDRQDVTIAHHEIDIVQRNAFGIEAVVDDFLKKSGGVFFSCDPLLVDGEGNCAVAQQARAHVVVVCVYSEYVDVLFHRMSFASFD